MSEAALFERRRSRPVVSPQEAPQGSAIPPAARAGTTTQWWSHALRGTTVHAYREIACVANISGCFLICYDGLCHEVAQVAVHLLHGPGCRPHGPEWAALMRRAGYPMSDDPRRPAPRPPLALEGLRGVGPPAALEIRRIGP